MGCVHAQQLPTSSLSHDQVDVVILGDSNCWIAGDKCTGEQGWPAWFVKLFSPASCRSYARSGATWTNTPRTRLNTAENIEVLGDDNVIYNQVMRLCEAVEAGEQPLPELIVVSAGINDAWFARKRPQAFGVSAFQAAHSQWCLAGRQPSQVLTLAEAVVFNCQLLRDRFPDALILLVAPAHATVVESKKTTRAGSIIESSGQTMDIATVRLDLLGPIKPAQECKRHLYTSDGVHTSVRGAKAHAEIICAQAGQLFH
ncbi:MAG: SGNH/GDSL hydrolase family protein [Muribaculaceae bacterium]|nr:SGNH/GDSL hydrolase family protein [Muribaculaceae bacterium]